MLKFISKFPFLKIEKAGYERIVMNDGERTDHQKEMIKHVKEILSVNQIPTNKIRFVFVPVFLYDIDNDEINPVFTILMPKNLGWRNKKPIVEIGKPENTIRIKFNDYVDIDDYNLIKPVVKASKKGVVIYIDEFNFNGIVGAINLDISIAHYNQFLENFEYNS